MTPDRLEALLYDWECDHTLERQTRDALFFDCLLRDHAPTNGRVAVLGCGTGRVAIPLARAGWRVMGLDISAERLALARAKASGPGAPDWRIGDMRDIPPEPRQDAMIVPYSAFLLLLTDADRLACLTSICRALTPQGIAIIDVSPNFPRKPARVRSLELCAYSPAIGGWVEYRETVHQQRYSELTFIGRRYYIRFNDGDALRVTYVERWRHLWPTAAEILAHAAGLRIVHGFANYDGAPLYVGGTVVSDAAKHIYVMMPVQAEDR